MAKIDKAKARERFCKAFEEYKNASNKSEYAIADELDVDRGTLRNSTDSSKNTLNADVVIAFCTTYKTTTVDYIYTGIENDEPCCNEEKQNEYTLFKHSPDCVEITDETILGTYYGYCQNSIKDSLDPFVLTIEQNRQGFAIATLKIDCYVEDENRKPETFKKILSGKPMFLKPDIVFIVFQADKGDDMYIMSFKWIQVNHSRKIYCRYGGLITPCRATNRYPQIQSFVFLDKPVKDEHLHYIKGFLKLNEKQILVPAKAFDDKDTGLINNKYIKTLFDSCEELRLVEKPFYCFSEELLLASAKANGVDYDTTAAAIMLLKEHSVNPEKISYPDNNTYSKFLSHLTSDEHNI